MIPSKFYYNYEVRAWNRTAFECYQRGCRCDGCFIHETYMKPQKWKCQMKAVVIELVKKFGITKEIKERFLKEEENDRDQMDKDYNRLI